MNVDHVTILAVDYSDKSREKLMNERTISIVSGPCIFHTRCNTQMMQY